MEQLLACTYAQATSPPLELIPFLTHKAKHRAPFRQHLFSGHNDGKVLGHRAMQKTMPCGLGQRRYLHMAKHAEDSPASVSACPGRHHLLGRHRPDRPCVPCLQVHKTMPYVQWAATTTVPRACAKGAVDVGLPTGVVSCPYLPRGPGDAGADVRAWPFSGSRPSWRPRGAWRGPTQVAVLGAVAGVEEELMSS